MLSRRQIAFALVALLCGCAGLTQRLRTEPPVVSLVSVEPAEIKVLQQTFKLVLNLQNPNDFPLPIRGLSFAVAVNGEDFASGVSNQSVDLPAFGEAEMQVDVRSGLLEIINNLSRLGAATGIGWRIDGSVKVEGIPVRLTFSETGELGE